MVVLRANGRNSSQHCCRSYTLTGFKLNILIFSILHIISIPFNCSDTALIGQQHVACEAGAWKQWVNVVILKSPENGRNIVGHQHPTLLDDTFCVCLHTLLHVV